MNVRPNGLGGTTGDTLATCKPLQLSGAVWYVNATGGVDAAAPAGKDREKPLATLGQAITNAAAGDTVVCLSGHAEVLTVALSISKQLFIVGEGSSSGKPTVTFTMNAAAQDTFSVGQANTELRNLYFPEASQTNAGSGGGKVNVTAAGCRLIGCYFEQGAKDNLAAVVLGAGATSARLVNTTIISTATLVATRPLSGVSVTAALADIETDGLTLSDGTVGFASGAWSSAAVILTRLRMQSLSLLLGAEILMNAASTGWINAQVATGGGRIDW